MGLIAQRVEKLWKNFPNYCGENVEKNFKLWINCGKIFYLIDNKN